MTSPASSGLRVAARRAARLSSVAAVAVPRTSASDSQRMANRAAAEKPPAGSLDRPSPGGSLLIALRLLYPSRILPGKALGLGSPHPRMRFSSALPRCEVFQHGLVCVHRPLGWREDSSLLKLGNLLDTADDDLPRQFHQQRSKLADQLTQRNRSLETSPKSRIGRAALRGVWHVVVCVMLHFRPARVLD